MKTRALGLFLMVAGACAYSAGCGSSGGGGGSGGATGAGGKLGGSGGATGTGGKLGSSGGATGTGGAAPTDGGIDIRPDAQPDSQPDVAGDVRPDATDAPADVPSDGATDVPTDRPPTDAGDAGPVDAGVGTFTQVQAILADISSAASPGCIACHDGLLDGGVATTLPHSMDLTVGHAFASLVNVASLQCGPADAGIALRVAPNNAAASAIVSKIQGRLGGTACDLPGRAGGPLAMPPPASNRTITQAQLDVIVSWINAGALNN